MELRVVVGPSGSGKRTRMNILQDLFGFMTVTGVMPEHVTSVVRNILSVEGDDLRLVIEIPTIQFSAQSLRAQTETFVDACMNAFVELKDSFPGADLAIVFQYCAQQELMKRQALGFHPLMQTAGNLQAAIFTECTTQVQLFRRLCEACDDGRLEDHELIFSDRSGKTADQLKDEISQRRYLKHPDDPDDVTAESAAAKEGQRRQIVKQTIKDIQTTLKAMDVAPASHRDASSLQFISRGWNAMQATILDLAKAQKLVRSKSSPHLNGLLIGESGTGKEAIAAFLHYCRPASRRDNLVTVDCTAMPEYLLESELFGSRKGAFTGAENRPGLVQNAKDGTVFLDEIGLMPISLQAKLLRFVETRRFRSLGSKETFDVPNCRVIAATSRNLDDAVQRGTFLVDLYNRLRAVTITLPPLRERREDIPLLLRAYAPEVEFKPAAEALLFDYGWEGNVRELRSVAERYNTARLDNASAGGPRGATAIGVSTLLDDWPHSVARDYLEGAMKWRWPMREQQAKIRVRIYNEVRGEMEQSLVREDSGAGTATHTAPATPAGQAAGPAPDPVGRPATEPLTSESFRRQFKLAVKHKLFTKADERAALEELAREALEEHGGDKAKAAKSLGVPRSTFLGWLPDEPEDAPARADEGDS